MSGTTPPFGTFAPGAATRAVRALAARTGQGRAGRLLRSALLRLAGAKRNRAWDIIIFGGARARLHPADNLCEKRVFASETHWDAVERAFIAARAADGTGPFRFVDVGANVGLYLLAARSAARAAGRPFRGLAIEPQPAALARLAVNLAASDAGAEVHVCPWAATATRESVRLAVDAANLGAARLDGVGASVEGRPLLDAVEAAGLDAIDVMKIDIEGREEPALRAFFDTAPRALWPRAIVIEAHRGDLSAPGAALCLDRGYRVAGTTRMNALLEAPDD